MSLTKIWIHMVWSTKNRVPVLEKELRGKLFDHINQNAEQKEIQLHAIGGYLDHVHCLINLKPSQTIMEVANLIKGESSYWINRQKFFEDKFAWQKEYYAESIGAKDIGRVMDYILNQEEHHQSQDYWYLELPA
jgi:putative transposase